MPGGPPRHVSIEQLRVMVNFMCQHVDLAAARLRSLEARYKSKALWEELATLLNRVEGGSKKTGYGWSKYWSDWKHKLNNKAKMYRMKGPSEVMLSRVEKRALAILGPSFKKKSNSLRVHAHQPLSPTVIKLEEEEEDEINNLSSEERVSDEHSVSSNDEDGDGDNADQSSNDPLSSITNLYPKWLIDVEKKRADAELSRAKAEEKRAVVAAKAAEASLMQAEALKTLAEATSNQADALMRIAMVLESRFDRNVFSI